MDIVIHNLINQIKKKIDNYGIYYRIFGRVKDERSIKEKLDIKNEKKENYVMQDFIGIRIISYFNDDNDIIVDILKDMFVLDNCKIDDHDIETFKPRRCNYVFKLPESDIIKLPAQVDNTFEVQLRTVFSEGWHEIDHDIRYKSDIKWDNLEELSRAFNGVLASLETSEFTIIKIFEEIAYNSYRSGDWETMIYNKMRSRMLRGMINSEIKNIIETEKQYLKLLFKHDRNELLKNYRNDIGDILIPFNINNFLFYCNRKYFKDIRVENVEPLNIKNKLNKIFLEESSPGSAVRSGEERENF